MPKIKKQWEVRYFVTAVASVPLYKCHSKTETYKQAAKPGWGTVEWYSAADDYKNPVIRDRSDKTQQLCCDEDCSASLYTKNGGYFGIFPYEEINAAEMLKQAECAAIITSDSCGLSFWAEDFSKVHIFVTYDENGLIDSYRVEYDDTTIYFCHPYSSYERGSNENENRMIRRHFPKGTDFGKVTAAQVKRTERWIARYPRKILGWKTSEIVFNEYISTL